MQIPAEDAFFPEDRGYGKLPILTEEERRVLIAKVQKGSCIRRINPNGETIQFYRDERKLTAENCSPYIISELEIIAMNMKNLGILERLRISRAGKTAELTGKYRSSLGMNHRKPRLVYCRTPESGKAMNQMIEGNLALVIKIAEKNQGRGVDIGDLVQEGSIGLARAVDNFDLNRKNKIGKPMRFSTLAYVSIQKEINKAVVIERRKNRYSSFNSLSNDCREGEDAEYLDILEDSKAVMPGDSAISAEEQLILTRFLKELNERNRAVILLYQEKPIKEIAEILRVSPQSISQIRDRALRYLQARAQYFR